MRKSNFSADAKFHSADAKFQTALVTYLCTTSGFCSIQQWDEGVGANANWNVFAEALNGKLASVNPSGELNFSAEVGNWIAVPLFTVRPFGMKMEKFAFRFSWKFVLLMNLPPCIIQQH